MAISSGSPCFSTHLLQNSNNSREVGHNILPKILNGQSFTGENVPGKLDDFKKRGNTRGVETFSGLVNAAQVKSYLNDQTYVTNEMGHRSEDIKKVEKRRKLFVSSRKNNPSQLVTLQKDKLCDKTIEKLKIAGIGVSISRNTTPSLSRLSKDSPRRHNRCRRDKNGVFTNDYMNSLYSERSQSKLDNTEHTASINEYLKVENARYTAEEKFVKSVLFQKWLKRVQRYIGKFQPVHIEIETTEAESNEDES